MASLPRDILFLILSRLDIRSLCRFRCVNKSWCSLIFDPIFVKSYLNRTIQSSNLNLVLFDFDRVFSINCNASSSSFNKAVRIQPPLAFSSCMFLGSCDGLLLICSLNKNQYFFCLWNPCTGEFKKLPTQPTKFPKPRNIHGNYCRTSYGLGYDPTIDDYKVVTIFCFDKSNYLEYGVMVYSLGTDSWRRVENAPCCWNSPGYFREHSGVLVSGVLHWVRAPNSKNEPEFIFAFDLKDEEFKKVALPDCLKNESPVYYLGVLGERLCFSCRSKYFGLNLDLWIMNDYGVKDSWVKQFTIAESGAQLGFIEPLARVTPLCFFMDGEVVGLIVSHESDKYLVSYDPINDRAKAIEVRDFPKSFGTAHTYVASLVSVKSGNYVNQEYVKEKRLWVDMVASNPIPKTIPAVINGKDLVLTSKDTISPKPKMIQQAKDDKTAVVNNVVDDETLKHFMESKEIYKDEWTHVVGEESST